MENQPYAVIFPGTKQWESIRNICKLTCSDYASAINSFDAYMSRVSLWKVKMKMKEREVNDYTKSLMDNGIVQEKLAIEWFESNPDPKIMYFRPGFFIDPFDNRLGGSPDGVLTVHGDTYAVEIKSPVNFVEDVRDVKWRHVIQLTGIMHASGFIYKGLLCYYNNMLPKPSLFVVKFDGPLWDFIYEHLKDFLCCLEGIPPRTPARKTFKDWDITPFVRQIHDLSELIPKKEQHEK